MSPRGAIGRRNAIRELVINDTAALPARRR
jgi:hypothetical protein